MSWLLCDIRARLYHTADSINTRLRGPNPWPIPITIVSRPPSPSLRFVTLVANVVVFLRPYDYLRPCPLSGLYRPNHSPSLHPPLSYRGPSLCSKPPSPFSLFSFHSNGKNFRPISVEGVSELPPSLSRINNFRSRTGRPLALCFFRSNFPSSKSRA